MPGLFGMDEPQLRAAWQCIIHSQSTFRGMRPPSVLLLPPIPVGQSSQERGGERLRAQVPGLQLLDGQKRGGQTQGARQVHGLHQAVSQATHASVGGRSMPGVPQLCPYVLGWNACFGLLQTPRVWRGHLANWSK